MRTCLRAIPALLIAFVFSGQLHAATVDTVKTFSAAMNKEIKAVVITPDSYKKKESKDIRYPVVYLLHGAGGHQDDWIKKVPELKEMADRYNLLIVCPDGNVTSWYFDSPVDPAWKYETYVAAELVKWTDEHYRTIADRKGRAITGLSMGGHGGMYLSFRHQDVYGAGGSMSGGVDFRPFPKNWDIAKRLGAYADVPERWDENTAVNLIGLLKPGSLSLIIDCGTDDFFFKVNNEFHAKLLENKIQHDYIVRPGGHTWEYWRNAVDYQLLFMSHYFKSKN
ncbi:alpha/beta hydrolase [Hufsiella ginkgonis]|uniref:Esterase family protein n=1 Tax=Hufsiella ginkgonis TaxID=2695274 RepID=A0A7K1XUY4_9SPHI|nr:alpha/beta hydrolase family protein [Hufsiella ginkgonis]MXV14579.1 esterase family protein [Hufsiella ginkgonis]